MAGTLRVKVTNKFPQVSRMIEDNVADITAKAALDIEGQAKARARVDTGHMRGAIEAEKQTPWQWTVTGYADYTVYNEFGTYKMSAQPMFVPALELIGPKYLAALRRSAV